VLPRQARGGEFANFIVRPRIWSYLEISMQVKKSQYNEK